MGRTAYRKTQDAKDYVVDKATDAKDFVVGKATDAKDYVAGKATDAKDFVVGKATDAKDFVQDRVEDVKDYNAIARNQIGLRKNQMLVGVKSRISSFATSILSKVNPSLERSMENVKENEQKIVASRSNINQRNAQGKEQETSDEGR